MDPSNHRKRVLHKLANELDLPRLNFQVVRRTIATLAQRKGTVKDVQGVMRHTRVATTTDIYMQEIAAGVRATVDSIHDELDGTMKKLAGKVRPPTETAASALVNLTSAAKIIGNGFEARGFRREANDEWHGLTAQQLRFATELLPNCFWGIRYVVEIFGGPDRDRTDDLFHAISLN